MTTWRQPSVIAMDNDQIAQHIANLNAAQIRIRNDVADLRALFEGRMLDEEQRHKELVDMLQSLKATRHQ